MKVYLALLLSILFWASAFVGIRDALVDYSPGALALLRFLTASVFLIPFGFLYKIKVPRLKDFPFFLVIGFIGITTYHVALNYGELTVTAATSSFIISSIPILTGIFSIVFLKEKIKFWGWLGIIISFCGIFLITFSEGELGKVNWGTLLVLIAAISGCVYVIFQKKMLAFYSTIEVTLWGIWTGTFFMLLYIPSLVREFPAASFKATSEIIYLGIFPGALSYLLWTYALSKFQSATHITSFLYLSPVITTLIGFIWMAEVPNALAITGGFVILGGVILTNTKGRKS